MRTAGGAQAHLLRQVRAELDGGATTRQACRHVGALAGVHPATLLHWWRASDRTGAPGRSARSDRDLLVLRVVAVVGVAVLGADVTLGDVLPTAGVVVAGLLPVWAASLHRFPGARPLLLLAPAAVGAGLVLLLLPGAHDVEARYAVATCTRTLTVVLGIGFVLWCRDVLRVETLALSYGAGALLAAAPHVAASANAWKYQLALPVTLLVLALAQRVPGPAGSVAVLVALAGLGAVSIARDYRSFFGFTVLTAVVVGWQLLRAGRRVRRRPRRAPVAPWLATGALVAVAGFVLYRAAEQLLLSGVLGRELQLRSQAQVRAAGSLLAGGRPEWAGTWRLVQDSPAGFGPGAVPTPHDVVVARQGLATVGIGPENGYVDNYMFGGQFRLHSTVADAWSSFGWVGVALTLLLGALLVHALLTRVAAGTASALVVLLGLRALWNLAVGPMYSDLPETALALALALVPRSGAPGRLSRGGRPRPVRAPGLPQRPPQRAPHRAPVGVGG
ncbi:hypothetical protein AB2L27_04890 [Kineococcus sp. LSe6-4]|uniref:O-antigen ligase domain-containing protein n=1 Tax=Kineococcus halophytocola TaxID=3234027 RepID=A0ABV4H075_9ACTN